MMTAACREPEGSAYDRLAAALAPLLLLAALATGFGAGFATPLEVSAAAALKLVARRAAMKAKHLGNVILSTSCRMCPGEPPGSPSGKENVCANYTSTDFPG